MNSKPTAGHLTTRDQKEQTVHNVQTALHSMIATADIQTLQTALSAIVNAHNHLTCMYCSISPLDCDVFGLLKETLTTDAAAIPDILHTMSADRLCKQCKNMVEDTEGVFCTDCSDIP